MTLGTLKINCYKLIDPSDEAISEENIFTQYEQDTAYSFYFLNMLNSINSAISRVVQACILPLKRVEIKYEDLSVASGKKRVSVDLSAYINDMYKLKLLEYEDEEGNTSKINYRLIGNYLDIVYQGAGSIIIYYYPKIKTIEYYYSLKEGLETINELDLNEIGLDDTILTIIPYFVKADLLEHDKPAEAILARNTFEQYISDFEQQEVKVTNTTKSWLGGYL